MKQSCPTYLLLLLLSVAAASAAAPAHDHFETPEILPPSSATQTNSNTNATAQENEPAILGNAPQTTVWYQWTAPSDGLVTISTESSSFDTLLALYTGSTFPTLNLVAANDDAHGSSSQVSALVTAGVPYRICVDGYEGGSGTIQLALTFQAGVTRPANDHYTNATPLIGSNITVSASNFLATKEPNELTPTPSGNASLWWTWEPPAPGRYTISTIGSGFDTILSIYDGTRLVIWNDNGETNREATVRLLNAAPGVRYHISVQGFAKATGTIKLEIKPDPLSPAPPWTVFDKEGSTYSSAHYRGKVVLLNFWATWCAPCLEEIPVMIALQNKYGPEGFTVIGISTDEQGFEVATPVMEQYQANYPSTVQNTEVIQNYGPFVNIPIIYIIDRDGMLVERTWGIHPPEEIENTVRQLVTTRISLTAALDGNQIVLRWPKDVIGYILQKSLNVPAANWTNVDNEPDTDDTHKIVRLPISGTRHSFRLIRN